MKTKISLLLITCLCSLACLAQSDFDKHFTKKSLRIDFALSGNSQFQAAAIQQLSKSTNVVILGSQGSYFRL